ncbi:hypothetical protein GCM10010254_59820 [Streptomyces chromofuscus]|nr:hypothetical protein GCM10010254_59820 [Streptomyces chromofuscus]
MEVSSGHPRLVQARERQLRLGLAAVRPDHPVSLTGRELGDVVQQSALAHTCVAAQHERPALRRRDEVGQHLLLVFSADHVPTTDCIVPHSLHAGLAPGADVLTRVRRSSDVSGVLVSWCPGVRARIRGRTVQPVRP